MARKQSPETQIRELRRSLTKAEDDKAEAVEAYRKTSDLLLGQRRESLAIQGENEFLRAMVDRLTQALITGEKT